MDILRCKAPELVRKEIWTHILAYNLTRVVSRSVVLPWMESDFAKTVELNEWDRDADHDGHNGPGWRVYCEAWGHVAGWQAVVAVKPAFMWYGK